MSDDRYVPKEVLIQLIAKSRDRCCVCARLLQVPRDEYLESKTLHKHHLVYVSAGGANTEANLVLVCPSCHARIHIEPDLYSPERLVEAKQHWHKMRQLVPETISYTSTDQSAKEQHAVQIRFLVVSANLDFKINAPVNTTVAELTGFISSWILHPLAAYNRLAPFKQPMGSARLPPQGLAKWSSPDLQIPPESTLGGISTDEPLVAWVDFRGIAAVDRFPGARATLVWREAPHDLDLHLLPLSGDELYHVSYARRGSMALQPWCVLEVDVRNGFGPEAISMSQKALGQYFVLVHNFSAEMPLVKSQAVVSVEIGSRHWEYSCPTVGDGTVWYVCVIDTSRAQPEEIGRIMPAPDSISRSHHHHFQEIRSPRGDA